MVLIYSTQLFDSQTHFMVFNETILTSDLLFTQSELNLAYVYVVSHFIMLSVTSFALFVLFSNFTEMNANVVTRIMTFLASGDWVLSMSGLIAGVAAIHSGSYQIAKDTCFVTGMMTTGGAVMSLGNAATLSYNRFVIIVLEKERTWREQCIARSILLPLPILVTLIISVSVSDPYTLMPSKILCWPNFSLPSMYPVGLTLVILIFIVLLFIVIMYTAIILKIRRTLSNLQNFFSLDMMPEDSMANLNAIDTAPKGKISSAFREEILVARRCLFIVSGIVLCWCCVPIAILFPLVTKTSEPPIIMLVGQFLLIYIGIANSLMAIFWSKLWLRNALRKLDFCGCLHS